MPSNKSYEILYWGIFAFVCICFTWCFMIFPYAADDWWYLSEILYKGTDLNGHHTMSMGLRESIEWHYLHDTSRIGNTLGAILLLVPKWLPQLVSSCSFCFGLWLMTKLAGIKKGETIKLIWFVFFVVFGVMWQEHMFTIMYAFNYIVVIPLYIGVILIFIRHETFRCLYAGILGLLLGVWHESYGLSFITSGIIVLLLNPSMRKRWRYIFIISAIIGSLWILCFSGTLSRANIEITTSVTGRVKHPFFGSLWLIVAVCFSICLIKKKWKSLGLSPLMIFTIVSGFTVIPPILIHDAPRATMPALLLSCCILIVVFSTWFPHLMEKKYTSSKIIAFIIFSITSIHLVAVCNQSYILRNKIDVIVTTAAMHKQKQGTVFGPVIYPWDSPWLTLTRPDQEILRPNAVSFTMLKLYLNDSSLPNIIPEDIKNFEEGLGLKIKGNREMVRWGDYIVSTDTIESIGQAHVEYQWAKDKDCIVHFIPFTGKDGKKYTYVLPIRSRLTFFAGKPQSIYILD